MRDMLLFVLYLMFASIDFGFAAKNWNEKHYMLFGFDLAFGIIFVFTSAALFISHILV